MTTELAWTPDPLAWHSDIVATATGVRYRVAAWHPGTTGTGSYQASADDVHLGRFPYSPAGRQAAQDACQAHASAAA